MKLMITFLMLAVCATGAWAQQTETFGWEDGVSTHLGFFGNLGVAENVDTMSHTGDRSLYMTEDPVDGTPQIYVAWIYGLLEGDEVTASFWSYDDTPDDPFYPRTRIWAHYSSNDIEDYQGSASGNDAYTTGIGWEEQSHTWTIDLLSNPDRTALVVEFRLYSAEGLAGPYYCDDITVTAPDHAVIVLANEEPVGTVDSSFGSVKALFR